VKLLQPTQFASTDELQQAILDFMADSNQTAKPLKLFHAPSPDPILAMARPNPGIHPLASEHDVAANGPPTASCCVLLIREGFSDGASSDGGYDGVGALVVGEGDQPDGECPAATSRPGRVIDRERCAEDVPGLGGEEIPRDLQVACWIAHAQTPEVDDGAEPTLLDQ